MATQGTDNLTIAGIPSVTKLWNNRFRLEFSCNVKDNNEGWYGGNIEGWLLIFGILQQAGFVSDPNWEMTKDKDWIYPEMRLVEAELRFIPSIGKNGANMVVLAYENLTSTLVPEIDDKEIELENGLKIIERVLIAESGVSFGGTVGSSTFGGRTLQQFEVENTDAITRVTARYSDTGILSKTEDFEGSQLGIVIESLGEVPATPVGYSLATTTTSNFSGFNTTRYSFLKDGAVMSISTRNLAEGVKEETKVFFKDEGTTVGPVVARSTQDVDGLPTISVTTMQDKDGNPLGADGSNPVSQFDQYIDFRYPGEVSIASDIDTVNNTITGDIQSTFTSLWYSLIPPVTSEINARIFVFFQTSNEIVASDLVYDGAVGLWNPNTWAKGTIDGLGTNFALSTARQTAQDKVFSEYTVVAGGSNSVSGTGDFATAGPGGGAKLVEGTYIFPGSAFSITVTGGPGRPDGIKYVVQAPTLTPAFDDVDGNQIWKKVIIVATIPTR